MGTMVSGQVFVALAALALLAAWRTVQGRWVRKTRDARSLPADETAGGDKSSSLEKGASKIKPLREFEWKEATPPKLRPFKPIYYITMALQSSTPSDLILMDCQYKDRVEHRRDLISKHSPIVVGAIPEGAAAVRELYAYLLDDYLPTRYPTMFSISENEGGRGRSFQNHITGRTFPLDLFGAAGKAKGGDDGDADTVREALGILGETVEDDIFLLDRTEAGHRSVAHVCCFPSGFDPSEKLGKVIAEIHKPVPSFDKIGASMERYFSRLEVGKSVKRVNWSVTPKHGLFNVKGNHIHDGDEVVEDEDVDIEKAKVRMELQTLMRLPETRAILFSFKTLLYPLREIKEEGLGPQMADAIEGLRKGNAPGMWVYKGGVGWGKSVCEYLRS